MTLYTQDMSDGVVTVDAIPAGISTSASDKFGLSTTYLLAYGAALSDGVGLSESGPDFAYQAGVLIHELVKLHGTRVPTVHYGQVLSNAVKIAQKILFGIPRSLTDSFAIQDVETIVWAASVIAGLRIKDSLLPATSYGMALIQALAVRPSLLWFFGGDLGDSLVSGDTVAVQFQAVSNSSETLTLTDVLGHSLLVSFTIGDDLELSDTELLNMIFAGDPLLDTFSMSAAYVDPGGGFTTWAINTRTGSVTEYQNYVFNSICKMGHQFLGADSTGLWLLDGTLDDTANIPTRIKSGWMQVAGSKFTSFKAAYLGLRADDDGEDFYLKLHSGDGREYVYRVRPRNLQTTKVNMGKGLRSRYFSFELTTEAADYDLDTIEFVPIMSQRRV